MSETVQFSDKSKAPPLEKARRYLKAMGDQRTNSAYFFDDGYPRRESAQDALATLAVLEQLAATPQPTQAQAGSEQLIQQMLSALQTCQIDMPGTRFKRTVYDEHAVSAAITAAIAHIESHGAS